MSLEDQGFLRPIYLLFYDAQQHLLPFVSEHLKAKLAQVSTSDGQFTMERVPWETMEQVSTSVGTSAPVHIMKNDRGHY